MLVRSDTWRKIENSIVYSKHIYLRNLLTHSENNLLQKLNNVKSIPFFVVKQIFNIIRIMCEISQQYLGYYAKYSFFNLKGSKLEVTKIGI